jgi:hypothetical protein
LNSVMSLEWFALHDAPLSRQAKTVPFAFRSRAEH